MVRASSVAVLRANAHILEVMAAQLEELAFRTTDHEEASRMHNLVLQTRLLARQHLAMASAERTGTAA